mgnify:CR=1 FL=1
MDSKRNMYLVLFKETFLISAFTFGGGYVIVPLMKKKFVEDLKLVEEKEMLDMIAIAQSSPGAIAINTSIILGYQLMGPLGAAVTTLGTVLPPLIIMSIVSYFYGFFKDNTYVGNILGGMQAGVAAIIIDVIINLSLGIFKTKKVLPITIMLISFIASYLLKINIVIIILVSGLIGLITVFLKKEELIM